MSAACRTPRDFRPSIDRCESLILLSASPLTPAQIRQAYSENFNFLVNGKAYAANGAGQTIAIVMEGLDSHIGSDLSTFDGTFNLPAPPSFRAVYFNGAQNNVTVADTEEESMDVEWAHAVAPGANILLVQAASWSESDMMTAVNYAREQPGVSVVSMSWGWHESSADLPYNADLTTPAGHTGVTFVAASGDTGAWTHPIGSSQLQFGVAWPAANPNVLSVGGTKLSLTSTGNYGGETAWNESNGASGGGISTIYAEPSYQKGVQSTGRRTVPDVSYNADSDASPIWIYDSYAGGWIGEGGTSAGAPQWAGLIAIANQGRALVHLNPLDGASQTLPAIYQFSSALHDVVGGNNGYYSAVRGYDEVTGLGSPEAIQLVGDLSFHVSSNYVPSRTATAAVPGIATGAGLYSAAGFDFASPGTAQFSRLASPPADTPADSELFLIPLTPNLLPTTATQPASRRGLHDMALESLLGEDSIGLS